MAPVSSRSGGAEHGHKQAGNNGGGHELLWSRKRGGEPELQRDMCHRHDVDCNERGPKRVAVSIPATRQSRRCYQRQSQRKAVETGIGAATFGAIHARSSMMLNKLPMELLETVLSCKICPFPGCFLRSSSALRCCLYRACKAFLTVEWHADIARGPQESSLIYCLEEISSRESSPLEAGSPTFEAQASELGSCTSRETSKALGGDLAPVQSLLMICARTCHRWNKAARSPQVLNKLSMVRFPLPAAPARRLVHHDFTLSSAAASGPGRSTLAAGGELHSIEMQAGDELLDERVEGILRSASRAGNDNAQFLLGLYLSRQKTFALLCLACPAPGSPAAEAYSDEQGVTELLRQRQEYLREAVLDAYDEGVELLRSAADLLHPNALYQLGMLAFGGTDVKLRARLFGQDINGGCGDCVLGEEHAELFWRRAAELGHLESRLIVDADFRLNHLQEMEDRMLSADAERRSWRLCAGNRLL